MSDVSLLNDLTKPATVLIEKIAEATGVLYEPRRIKNAAKAEAEAMVIRAKAEIEITDLQKRAMKRFIEEEGKRQENIEEITEKALPLLNENSEPEKIKEDWIANFFDKCRIVSDQDMQTLWAKVLAGEANKPNSFSLRTLDILKNMTSYEAGTFVNFSKAVIEFSHGTIEQIVLAHPPFNTYLYERFRITSHSISLLREIGLLSSALSLKFLKYKESNFNNSIRFERGSLSIEVELLQNNSGISLEPIVLSNSGKELLSLIEIEDDLGLMENLNKFFEGKAKTNPVIDENKEKFRLLKESVKFVRDNYKEHIIMHIGNVTTIREIAEEYEFPVDSLAEYNNLPPDSKPPDMQIKVPEYFFDEEGNVK